MAGGIFGDGQRGGIFGAKVDPRLLQAALEQRAEAERERQAQAETQAYLEQLDAQRAPRQPQNLDPAQIPPKQLPQSFGDTFTGATGEMLYGVPVAGPALLGAGERLGAAGRSLTGRQGYSQALEDIQTQQEQFRRLNPGISGSAQAGGSSLFAPAFGASMGAQVVGNAAMGGLDAMARGQDPTVAGVAAGGVAGATHLPAIFGGIAAKTADHAALNIALKLREAGASAKQIWKETGWFKGKDDKWRFEISDQESKLHSWGQDRIAEGNEVPAGKLGVLHHPDLYAAYPSLKETKLHGRVSPGSIGTQYGGSIGLAPDSPLRINKTLLHEMQHEVQDIEGFAKGGNTREFALSADLEQGIQTHLDDLSRAFDLQNEAKARGIPLRTILQEQLDKGTPVSVNAQLMAHLAAPEQLQADIEAQLKRLELAARGGHAGYSRLAGEAEARNVETRRYMTAEERRATPPWKTQDVPDEQQIVRFRSGGGAQQSVGPPHPKIRAYHGSPHDFERFDASKIGTGEGAQAYGHGLYVAENEAVAKQYRDLLGTRSSAVGDPVARAQFWASDLGSREAAVTHLEGVLRQAESRPKNFDADDLEKTRQAIDYLKSGGDLMPKSGHMYEVDIAADPEHFLDWDKPLNEQSPQVREKLEKVRQAVPELWSAAGGLRPALPGQYVIDRLGKTEKGATALREAGIPGIKYLDQGSRGAAMYDVGSPRADFGPYTPFRNRADAEKHLALLKRMGETDAEIKEIGKQTSNYVVFDDKLIAILKKYGLPISAAGLAALSQLHPQEAQAAQQQKGKGK